MIAVVATLRTKPGAGADFEAVAKELMAKVHANEPGCKLYQLCKSDEADTYVFIERYADQAALDAHRGTPHFKELGRKMGEFMAGRPEVKILQEV
jgi:quinol monooxygenase YgiN